MPKPPPPGSLLEQVRSYLPARSRVRWEESLPAEVRAELAAIKADWVAGKFGANVTKTGLGMAIAKSLAARDLPGSSHTVVRWLDAH
jgi:hypothetical protein